MTRRFKWRSMVGVGWTSGAMLLVVVCMTCAAFVVEESTLIGLVILNTVLIVHGVLMGAHLRYLLMFTVMQGTLTVAFFLLFHSASQLMTAITAVIRLLLAVIPAWWFASVSNPDDTASLFQRLLPPQWAFVVAASFNLLPFIIRELFEIYQLQRLRGARVSPRQLTDPRNWPEFVNCVLTPLIIQIFKLAKQLAIAAQGRHFGAVKRPTRWQLPKE